MEIKDLLATEYLVQAGRSPIHLRYHTTKNKIGWGVWRGKEMMLSPEGRWRYPDRRSIPEGYLFNLPEEALEHWQKHKDVEVWR